MVVSFGDTEDDDIVRSLLILYSIFDIRWAVVVFLRNMGRVNRSKGAGPVIPIDMMPAEVSLDGELMSIDMKEYGKNMEIIGGTWGNKQK